MHIRNNNDIRPIGPDVPTQQINNLTVPLPIKDRHRTPEISIKRPMPSLDLKLNNVSDPILLLTAQLNNLTKQKTVLKPFGQPINQVRD
jgi:hypothetical protein